MNIETGGSRPLVSIAIPVYNGQATLADSLRSVLAQTYPHIEVIVVDDGSTDGTWDVLLSFGPSIRAIQQANSGIASARNAGIQAARGDFIALMDADDLCEPERIAVQLQCLLEKPELVLCCSEFSAFDAEGLVSESHGEKYYASCSLAAGGVKARYASLGSLEIGRCFGAEAKHSMNVPIYFGSVYSELVFGNFVHPPTVMFRRRLLDEAGYFDSTVRIMCEWDWLVRAARVGPFGFIQRSLLRYRLSPSQISFSEHAPLDSIDVARRICARDPELLERERARFRKLFGDLYADAASSKAEHHPVEALSLLAASVLRYRTFDRRTAHTFLRALIPGSLLGVLRLLKSNIRR